MQKLLTPSQLPKIKGSKIDMSQTTETVLEIDLDALHSNYRYLRSKINPETKFVAVIKAFGYGSDSTIIANALTPLVDYFAVAYTYEGEDLRKNNITKPTMVFHALPVDFESLVANTLEPCIYSIKMLRSFIAYVEQEGKEEFPIHLKFNTGLNRLGFIEEEIPAIIAVLSQTKSVKVESVFSHLVASEDPSEREFSLKQIADFRNISEKLIKLLGYKPLLHCTNTSGVINYPEAYFDMVRSGIGLFGFGNNVEENKHLQPVATLKTVILQIHNVKIGESVGYNRAFIADRPTRSATLPLGHADGIARSYGNGKGWVMIKGKKAPFIGNVCMDMLMVDVTDIDCEEGDEVIVFGKSSTAEELTAGINSIPYELLTAISQRISRKVKES